MSTIERAMRKLGGDSEPLEGNSPTPTNPMETVETRNIGDEQAESVIETSSPRADETVDKREINEPVADIAGKKVQPSNPPYPDDGRYIELDFNRLKTMGFLIPGSSPMRLSEEYQTIKRRLIANTAPGILQTQAPKNLIMVTSSLPSEGKTYTSMNLALSIAQEVERRVLLIDVDIMKSDLSRLFGVVNRTGLYDVLAYRELGLEDVILRTNVPSMTLVPAGTIREHVTENLASQSMFELTREIATRYSDRLVILDCPPILATSSASALAPLVGQIVVVVESCKTTKQNLTHALKMMGDAHITGLILNKVRHRGVSNSGYYGYGYNYGYGYGYGYGNQPGGEKQ